MDELSEEAKKLFQKYEPKEMQPGDITVQSAMKSMGITANGVRGRLRKMVEAGDLVEIKRVRVNNSVASVWRIVDK